MIKKYKIIICSLIGLIVIGIGIYYFSNKQTFGVAGTISGEYQIVSGVKGYVTKSDPTNIAPEYLVSGSQNVVINDQERIETRAGYELFGIASTSATAITSDYVWRNSGATSTIPSEILLRTSGNLLQYYATSSFEDLYSMISTISPARFASVWSPSEGIDVLLFVNASTTLFEWSGGQGILYATTSNAIMITEAIMESRFLRSGTTQLRIKDVTGAWTTYTYTGVSGNWFTGVTPDPSINLATSTTIVQAIRRNVNKPAPGFVSDTIKVLNNQAWIGSSNSRDVWVTKNTDYTSFAFSSPRVPGEGAKITLDDTTIGFESPDDDRMLIFSGKDRIYQVSFEITQGDTGDREVPKIKPLLISSGQGALSQELIGKIKQAVVWISNNKELVELGQVENLPSPQAVAISDPIKPDFIDADFTNGDIEFWRNSIFITTPPSGKLFIYDLSKRFWQPPQIMGVRRLSQFGDLLYGHGQSVPETYKLFTGLSDNENDVEAKAHFAYVNGGRRDALKNFNRFFTEMYLASNTKADVSILYDWLGSKGIVTYELDGADSTFLFVPESSASIGVNPLGTNPLGGFLSSGSDAAKYRRFKPLVPKDAFEWQVRVESYSSSTAWQILSVGQNATLSNNAPSAIIK